jgi:hypothetical protein
MAFDAGGDSAPSNVSEATTLPDKPILVREDFNDGDMVGWTVVEEGTIDVPAQWGVQGGRLAQTGNIYGPTGSSVDHREGTFAYWDEVGAFSWTDYSYEVTLESGDDDGIGVMFRYQDANNYYKVDMDKQRDFRKLFKMKDGVETTLASEAGGYEQDAEMRLQVSVIGDQISVSLDGTELFGGPVQDGDLTAGVVALYAWGNVGSYFDDVWVLQEGSGLAAPVNLVATAVSPDQIDLVWEDRSNNEQGFRVEHCAGVASGCSSYGEIAQVGADVTSYSHVGLDPESAHSYRVMAFDAGGDSAPSNVAEATTGAGPIRDVAVTAVSAPGSVLQNDPADVEVTVANEGALSETFDVSLTDTPPGGGVAGTVSGPQTVTLAPGASTTLTFTWDTTGATVGIHRLTATAETLPDETDTGDNSRDAFADVVVLVAAPTNLVATAVSSSQIDLVWDDTSAGEQGFRIEHCPGAAASCTSYVEIAQVGPNSTSYSHTGLTALTTHSYRVVAFDEATTLAAGSTPQLLLGEDFNDGDMVGWTVVEEGTIDVPAQWGVQGGRLAQTSNIYGPTGLSVDHREGTFAYWDEAGAFSWTDYTYEVTLHSTDDDGIGVLFRYQDANNYYKVDMDKQRNFRTLFKVKDGVETNGGELFGGPVQDSDLTAGTVALYCWGNAVSYFDQVQVAPALLWEDFSDGDMVEWSVVDEGTQKDPSQWSVQGGRLAQTSNIYGPRSKNTDHRQGTFAYWNDAGAFSWTDYTYEVTLHSTAGCQQLLQGGYGQAAQLPHLIQDEGRGGDDVGERAGRLYARCGHDVAGEGAGGSDCGHPGRE